MPSQKAIEALVKIRRQGAAFGAGLPVNPDFAPPNQVDRSRGVDYNDPERDESARAVTARTRQELAPTNIRVWIWRQQRSLGGNDKLADALIDTKPIPEGRDPKLYRRALLRALQRSGPAQRPGRKEEHPHGIKKPDYRERIALLMLRQSQVVLAVYGLWAYVTEKTRESHYNWMYTDPSNIDELEAARGIVARGGHSDDLGHDDDLVSYVWRVNNDKTVGSAQLVLDKLHGVQVQVDPGRLA